MWKEEEETDDLSKCEVPKVTPNKQRLPKSRAIFGWWMTLGSRKCLSVIL